MSKDAWHKGYQEVRNVIHNEMGMTKEELRDIFREIAKEEIHEVVREDPAFIRKCIHDIIKMEMFRAIEDDKYPKIRKSYWNYTDENKFEDFVTDIAKEEILDMIRNNYNINMSLNVQPKKTDGK